MKKIAILAISAILCANLSAQEVEKEKAAAPDQQRVEKPAKPSKAERIEREIKQLTRELYLSGEQAEKFAATYREFAGKLDELFEKKGDCKEQCKEQAKERAKELTDKELDKINKGKLALQKEIVALKEKYYDKFRKDLNPKQTDRVLRFREEQARGPQGQQPGKFPGKMRQDGPQGRPVPGPRGEQPRPQERPQRPENGFGPK